MDAALAIFVKTPGLSDVKTRLAKSIGKKSAEDFFIECVGICQTLAHELIPHGVTPYWAVGEDAGLDHSLWQNLDRMVTSDGSLGKRLDYVYRHLKEKHDIVVLIGMDCPLLTKQDVLDACDQLQNVKNTQAVIGPTLDGGFYLFASKTDIPGEIWMNARLSTANAMCDITDGLAEVGQHYHVMHTRYDVDTIEDLERLAGEMPSMAVFLP